jgi:hypothetical protein
MNSKDLELEADRITELLKAKTVKCCMRHDSGELVVIFKDGTKLFVNSKSELHFSIT